MSENAAVIFGERLHNLRKRRNLSQEELGLALGRTKNNISQLENGKREPNLALLTAISNYFGVSTDYLLGLTDQMEKPSVIPLILYEKMRLRLAEPGDPLPFFTTDSGD